jgi:diaminopimelate decarboxylase
LPTDFRDDVGNSAVREVLAGEEETRQPHTGILTEAVTHSAIDSRFKKGPTQICSVFGPTCDALDTISMTDELPDLDIGELVYAENIGAYSAASSTYFNRFPPAKVVRVNQEVAVTG